MTEELTVTQGEVTQTDLDAAEARCGFPLHATDPCVLMLARHRIGAAAQARAEAVEQCAKVAEDVAAGQAEGWDRNPRQDGCGGAVAAANTGMWIARSIRNLLPQANSSGGVEA